MPLPISHGLIDAGIVALVHYRNSIKQDWMKLLLGAFFAISPDFDFFIVFGLHLSRGWHRSFTHSIPFACIIAVLLIAVMGLWCTQTSCAYGLAFLSHGLLDYLTTKQGGGVQLLFPFSMDRLRLGLFGVSEFPIGINLSELVKTSLIEIITFAHPLLFFLILRETILLKLRSK